MCSLPDMVKVTEKEKRNSSDNLVENYIPNILRYEIDLEVVNKEDIWLKMKDWI